MSEPAAKQRQMIDLDEFERRLSRSPSPARNDDPLAELARLVGGGEDRFESMFQARPTRGRAPEPQQLDDPHHVPDWLAEESHQHAQPKGSAARRTVDFAAIEAGLRGSLSPEFQDFTDAEDRRWHEQQAPHHHQPHQDDYAHDDYADDVHARDAQVQEHYADEDAAWLDAPVARHAEPIADARSRMPLYATAAIIIAGMLGIGATFAMKRTPAAPTQIALIKAPTTPIKVAVADGGADTSASNNSILDKTPPQSPTAAVSHTEQPVDVNAVGKPAPAAQVAATAPAAAVPVPPPPSVDASQDLGEMVQPHKVKTIAVRPDGSFADSAAPSPPPGAAPAADPAVPSMVSNFGGASLAPTPAPAPPEPTRVPPASDDLPWSAQSSQNAAPAAAAPHPSHKPVRVARAETGADEAAAAPASGGGFSVQLAAPGSEAEAHAALVRLTRSYGAELHGYRLKYRQAKVGAKSVYRVRVGGLSHAAAISLCERLKAKGAACFLARG